MRTGSAAARKVKPGRRPASREAEVRLQRVLDVAKQNFLRAGYPETCLDTIARESRIAKKTIYSRFGSKAGLFSAILQPLRQSWIDRRQSTVIESDKPEIVPEAATRIAPPPPAPFAAAPRPPDPPMRGTICRVP